MPRRLSGRAAQQILEAIEEGRQADPPQPPVRNGGHRPEEDVLALYDRLRAWRTQAAARRGVEPDVVLTNQVLMAIAQEMLARAHGVLRHPGRFWQLRGCWGRGSFAPTGLKSSISSARHHNIQEHHAMKLQFWGATRTVTGSMHFLEVNGARILLDCGLFQGSRSLSYERNLNFPFDPATIDVLVLSHAHIDHSGNIPNLTRQGFKGNIFCTPSTRDLCAAMLLDSARIQEQDIAYVNKKRARKGEPPVEPLYTEDDATACLGQFVSVPYWRPLPIVPGVTLTLHDAGHILGSAIVQLDITEGAESKRLVFSGDLGRAGLAILRDPEFIDATDYLIMESTYGDRDHETHEEATQKLRECLNQTYRRGGMLLIPSFAVGRTQELVYSLHKLSDQHKIPKVPIFVDSPLAVNVTEIFRLHPDAYDQETRQFMSQDVHHSPFGFDDLTYVRKVEDSKALNFLREPAVIIAASGMCEGGRILHHLKNHVGDPKTTVLFVGFQAENTLGRRIAEGEDVVKIFGEPYRVRADVERIEGYSAHADRGELRAWAGHFDRQRLKHVFLVHGELDSAAALAYNLRADGLPAWTFPTVATGLIFSPGFMPNFCTLYCRHNMV